MMDNVQVERWTFQPWHGGFWWCHSHDYYSMMIWVDNTGWSIDSIDLAVPGILIFWTSEARERCAGEGWDWECVNLYKQPNRFETSFFRSQNKLSMCGGFWQGLGNVKVFTAHMDLSYRRPLPANSVYLVDVCVDKIERQKSLSWDFLPGKSVAWLRESGLSKIDQLYWSESLVSCTSLPLSCESVTPKESVSKCDHLWQRRACVRESESALHHQEMMKWSIVSIGSIGFIRPSRAFISRDWPPCRRKRMCNTAGLSAVGKVACINMYESTVCLFKTYL